VVSYAFRPRFEAGRHASKIRKAGKKKIFLLSSAYLNFVVMKTFTKQCHDPLGFLLGHGLDVQYLEFGRIIRCHGIGHTQGRGELAYFSHQNEMKNGCVGIVTWCRDADGKKHTLKSYGLPSSGTENENYNYHPIFDHRSHDNDAEQHEESARRAYGFWKHSFCSGTSDYLIRKGVGYHGIRFRSNEYGNVAVVPLRDEKGKLWSYQLLNPDGSKRMPKNARTRGLFHTMCPLVDEDPIGIAEGYVTAATRLEVGGIPTVCAFSADNIPSVAKALRSIYPGSHLILFSDNDRHLKQNIGVVKAKEALFEVRHNISIAIPNFGLLPPSKDASDWNDLMCLMGIEEVKQQILQTFPH
jgi:hypothetical protein